MSKIIKETFGHMPDGQTVDLYRMVNERGSYVEVINLGITIRSIVVNDKEGIQRDIVLGYDSVQEYLENDGYIGLLSDAMLIASVVLNLSSMMFPIKSMQTKDPTPSTVDVLALT